MADIRIELCERLPEEAELNGILAQYYAEAVERMGGIGIDVDPAAPESALAEFWANVSDYLPPEGCLVLARKADGEIVGCTMMKRVDARTGELKRSFVAKAARGTGLGRRLFEARVEAARAMGLTRLVADTLTPNVEMRSLYLKMGFVEVTGPIETRTWIDQPMLRPHMLFFVRELGEG